ncbi:MAG: hypothetical protein COV78_04690 [Candidatus Pacebacteria bacterium CG11_big_fil_rev_8_21_14_0_20_34_55]|nr:MAG: hypothetical protein COV78_04690 [Candidatus Pacebacteria bacterium CG11_big_fil_rev_8_21_14_0_20_34_55]PJC43369.1 MAG: hypothetical protein CO039_04335 [Candidatus Pacebacteria bacterium CG_4_9_14_0_2_um_filter_34_50]
MRVTKYLKKINSVQNKFLTLAISSGIFLFVIAIQPAFAQNLTSNSWIIQFGNFNVTSGEKNSASYNVTDTVGQTGSGPYGSYGSSSYFVGSGFQYIYQIDNFSFDISKTLVNLGELVPNIHSTDSHTLTITTKGAGGYSVYAYEIHPLRLVNGADEIVDTTCNTGSCTHLVAGVWNNQSIPGFGYNMSGNDIPANFIDSTYYKNFADDETADNMQIVMSSVNIASQRQATVTYKAGINSNQASGNYETGIIYVAVPGY